MTYYLYVRIAFTLAFKDKWWASPAGVGRLLAAPLRALCVTHLPLSHAVCSPHQVQCDHPDHRVPRHDGSGAL